MGNISLLCTLPSHRGAFCPNTRARRLLHFPYRTIPPLLLFLLFLAYWKEVQIYSRYRGRGILRSCLQ
jgi:hypothetical protein